MGAAENRVKSQKMAEDLKRRGVRRTTGRCPICYRMVGVGDGNQMSNHLRTCSGPRRKGDRASKKR